MAINLGQSLWTKVDNLDYSCFHVHELNEPAWNEPALLLGQKKVSSFWSQVGIKIGAVTRGTEKYVIGLHVFAGDQISHTQSMAAKEGLINRANGHTPMGKSHLKHSTAEF